MNHPAAPQAPIAESPAGSPAGSPATPQAPPVQPVPNYCRAFPVAKLAEFGLSDALVAKINTAGIETIDALSAFRGNFNRIEKIGKAKADKIEEALAKFVDSVEAWTDEEPQAGDDWDTDAEPEPTAANLSVQMTDNQAIAPLMSVQTPDISPAPPVINPPPVELPADDRPRTHTIEAPQAPPADPPQPALSESPAGPQGPAGVFMPPMPSASTDWQRWPIYSILGGSFPDQGYYDRAREAVAALSNSTGQRPSLYNLKELIDELWARGGIPDLTYDQMRSLRFALIDLREKNTAFAAAVAPVVIDPTLDYQVYQLSFAGDANNANGYCVRAISGPAVNAYIARQHPEFRGRVDLVQGPPPEGIRIITLETPRYEDRHPRIEGSAPAVA
jgi:hypothetical protein